MSRSFSDHEVRVSQFPKTGQLVSQQFGAEKSRIGGFISEPPHRSQTHVNGRRSKVLLFQEKSVPEDDSTIESKAWFRAVPADELIDCMSVRFLR